MKPDIAALSEFYGVLAMEGFPVRRSLKQRDLKEILGLNALSHRHTQIQPVNPRETRPARLQLRRAREGDVRVRDELFPADNCLWLEFIETWTQSTSLTDVVISKKWSLVSASFFHGVRGRLDPPVGVPRLGAELCPWGSIRSPALGSTLATIPYQASTVLDPCNRES